MGTEAALADLMEISAQVEEAVLLADGEIAGATADDPIRSEALARAAREALIAADRVRSAAGRLVTQLQATTRAGSLFVVRDGDRTVAATTGPSPTAGLVLYDLRTCLRRAADSDASA